MNWEMAQYAGTLSLPVLESADELSSAQDVTQRITPGQNKIKLQRPGLFGGLKDLVVKVVIVHAEGEVGDIAVV